MTREDFDRSVRGAFDILVKLGLTNWDRQICLRSMNPPPDYHQIAFSAKATYEEVFRAGLRYRAFNFLLEDYSYFQFWNDSKFRPRALRYGYCPNPFEVPNFDDFLSGAGIKYPGIDVHEAFGQALEEASLRLGRPLIRYDVDLERRVEIEHPAAHFTIGAHTENRWPVARVLTPKLFVLFVSKLYYPEDWSRMVTEEESVGGYSNQFDQLIADEKRISRLFDEEEFSAKERLHLFIE